MRIFLTGIICMVGRNIKEHKIAKQDEILAPCRNELDLTNRSKIKDYFLLIRGIP